MALRLSSLVRPSSIIGPYHFLYPPGTREKTEAAFAKLSDSVISGRRLRVDYAQNKGKADPGVLARSTQLYVANVNLCVNEQVLTAYFSQFGKVRHCMIVRQAGGTSKGFAFVEFDVRPQFPHTRPLDDITHKF